MLENLLGEPVPLKNTLRNSESVNNTSEETKPIKNATVGSKPNKNIPEKSEPPKESELFRKAILNLISIHNTKVVPLKETLLNLIFR